MIRLFFYPKSTRYVLFAEQTLKHMYANAQRWPWQKEAGGELFCSEPDAEGVIVCSATGPNPGDRRSRYAWNPDTLASDRNRQAEYHLGRHPIGLWHTHPETHPSPSALDRQTTLEYLESYRRDRSWYLMVTIGNRGTPLAMDVWVGTLNPCANWVRLVESKMPIYQ